MATEILTAATEAQLNADIDQADLGAPAGTTIEIDLTASLTLTHDLDAINFPAGEQLVINGEGQTLDGAGMHRGLFAYNGSLTVENLALNNMRAQGGAGGLGGGGGGAGLGGGLFVAAGAKVTLSGVTFSNDQAVGGQGGSIMTTAGANGVTYGGANGGGGGLGGAGGAGVSIAPQGNSRPAVIGGGGGGIGSSAFGGSYKSAPGPGIIVGAGGAGNGTAGVGSSAGGANGGGGGGASSYLPSSPPDPNNVRFGFGGGGGGGIADAPGNNGSGNGWGGGDGSAGYAVTTAAGGGFGGGGGASFGYGPTDSGPRITYGGGGGLGAGGGIFVQQGGGLTFGAGQLSGGSVTGGQGADGANSGLAFGTGIFVEGNDNITLAPAAAQNLTIDDIIADQYGAQPSYVAYAQFGINNNGDPADNYAGAMGLVLSGAGTVNLAATNIFTGTVAIQSGTLDLTAVGAAGSGAISFAGATSATLEFTAANAPTNTIGSFGQGNAIHVDDFFFTGDSYSGQALSLSGTGGTISLAIPGYTLADFQISNDLTGTEILSEVPCYLRGTLIATPGGETLVEALRVGDGVTTHDGRTQVVTWIGHRRVDCARHPQPRTVWPVRIQAGAFGRQAPRQDLFLSPDHAVFADGILIPIKHLINDRTVTQQARDDVTYYHVELHQHDVLLAEGLPCESYLDNGTRTAFINGGGTVQLYPDFSRAEHCEAIGEAASCAPLLTHGNAVDRVVTRLRRRALALGYECAAPTRRKPQRRAHPATADLVTLLQPNFYQSHNPDVVAAAVDPAAHYYCHGRQEGRAPCSDRDLLRGLGLLEPATIIRTMADVVAAGIDPVEHFCVQGWQERRNPNPYFDTGWYLDTHQPPIGLNPLVHYVLLGEYAGLAPSRHFDPAWYRQYYRLSPSTSALAHHLLHRRSGLFSPLPSFDIAGYVQSNTAILRPSRDPYAHYRAIGRFKRSTAAA